MALKFSDDVRSAMLDALETNIGASAILKFWTGAAPANCAAADSGTCVATLNLPADWMGAAAAGVKALSGSWSDAAADADGTIGHFRVYDSGLAACDIQGTVTVTGGGGDLTVDNTNVLTGQTVTVTGFTLTAGNA